MEVFHLFDPIFYREKYVDIVGSDFQALRHFIAFGQHEGRDPSALFSTDHYTRQLRESAATDQIDFESTPPFLHYLTIGWKKGFDPSPFFKTDWYISNNPDVAQSGINPLFHYLKHGIEEDRPPSPTVDLAWYAWKYGLPGEPKAAVLRDLVRSYPAKALSDQDFSQRFGFRTISAGVQKRVATEISLARLDRAEAAVPALDQAGVAFPDIADAPVLTVDVWDTLLRRDCHPDEIKLQTARFLLAYMRNVIRPHFRSAVSLLRARFEAEREVATEDWEYQIQSVFWRWLQIALSRGVTEQQQAAMVERLLDHELRAEARATRLDRPCVEALSRRKRPTYFVSDFYTSRQFILNLLAHHGVDRLFAGGFVSSDTFETKRSGTLYGRVASDLDVAASDGWVHVGDNPHADIAMARARGIDARLYADPAEIRRTRWFGEAFDALQQGRTDLHEVRLRAITEDLAEAFEGAGSRLEAAGARLAPIAVGFVLSALEDALAENAPRIHFFTREGQFFRDVAAELVRADPYCTTYPEVELLEVSRRATFAASLTTGSIDELMRMWSLYSTQSPEAFAVSLNLDPAETQAACRRVGLPFRTKVVYPWADERFRALLADEAFGRHLAERLAQQRRTLGGYLRERGVPAEGREPVVIVDIGWRGTIQDNVAHLTTAPVRGHYLGLLKFLNRQPQNCGKSGWLYDENHDHLSSFVSEVAPLEMIFNAAGGSVAAYEEVDGKFHARRTVVEAEERVITEFIAPIQRGMLAAVRPIADYVRLHGLTAADLRGLAQALIVALTQTPPAVVADAFLALEHNETFGTGEVDVLSKDQSVEGLLEMPPGAELHHGLWSAARGMRWPEALYGCSQVSAFWERGRIEQRLTVPVALSAIQARRARRSFGRVNVYAPSPLLGSGGHRTIYKAAKAIQDLGFELHCFVEGEGDGLHLVEEWLGETPAFIHSRWHRHIPADYALATIAHSARFVAELPSVAHRGYLVQDFEASFNPVNDIYVDAENSYSYGLTHHTIGRWLSHVIPNLCGGVAVSSGLGIDPTVYRRVETVERERAICFLYQPEKPRRLSRMALGALELVKRVDPSVKIYAYGSNDAIHSSLGIENLGLILDLKEINLLYNRCSVGLCLSLTNPSRIPFEMMAAGCIPVDLYRYNNLFDYEDGTALLAYQSAESLAHALLTALNTDEAAMTARRETCARVASRRTTAWESDVVANAVLAQIENRTLPVETATPSYRGRPLVDRANDRPQVWRWCEHQMSLARMRTAPAEATPPLAEPAVEEV
ncbi:rhamnosyltransferase WsaF family glycosyltransferase [Methylobacterium sp. JK268]